MEDVIRNEKKRIRKEVLTLRDGLSMEQQKKASFLITERILGHQWFYLSDNILAFASYGSEIDTSMILEETLRQGKNLYLPKICDDEMIFYKVNEIEELVPGYKGILEPNGTSTPYMWEKENLDDFRTLLLMPGVAFDPLRNRIGYGKGFYDRFLLGKDALQIRSIAIGHECQLVSEIPADVNDIKPYQVILK